MAWHAHTFTCCTAARFCSWALLICCCSISCWKYWAALGCLCNACRAWMDGARERRGEKWRGSKAIEGRERLESSKGMEDMRKKEGRRMYWRMMEELSREREIERMKANNQKSIWKEREVEESIETNLGGKKEVQCDEKWKIRGEKWGQINKEGGMLWQCGGLLPAAWCMSEGWYSNKLRDESERGGPD